MKKNKIKFESFEIMQYLYSNVVHEYFLHCVIKFSQKLDVEALKRAIDLSSDAIKQIKCCVSIDDNRPCWINKSFSAEDIIKTVTVQNDYDYNTEIYSKLADTIDIYKESPLKIYLIRENKSDSLCFIMSHIICDGVGFKEYLYFLSNLYSKIILDKNYDPKMVEYTRGTKPIFSKLNVFQKIKVLFLKYDLAKSKKQNLDLKLLPDNSNPKFVANKISEDKFNLIKKYSKEKNVTINDIFLTAYIRELNRITGVNNITVPCPVDLRKYIKKGVKYGITNITSSYTCSMSLKTGDKFEDILLQVSKQMNLQKESMKSLKTIIILNIFTNIIPYKITKKLFNKILNIPVVSYTNLGIVDDKLLKFEGNEITDIFITATVKHLPYFQLNVSTYKNICTLSSNSYINEKDVNTIDNILRDIINDIINSIN